MIPHINTIDITKRCNYSKEMTLDDFLCELTTERVSDLMKKVISWDDTSKEEKEKYKKYLKKGFTVKDLPADFLEKMYGVVYTDGEKIFYYQPCCR